MYVRERTGLGPKRLANCTRVAELHGGDTGAQSNSPEEMRRRYSSLRLFIRT